MRCVGSPIGACTTECNIGCCWHCVSSLNRLLIAGIILMHARSQSRCQSLQLTRSEGSKALHLKRVQDCFNCECSSSALYCMVLQSRHPQSNTAYRLQATTDVTWFWAAITHLGSHDAQRGCCTCGSAQGPSTVHATHWYYFADSLRPMGIL